MKRSYVYVAINYRDGRRANKEESSLNANFLHYAGTGTSEVKNKSMISKHLQVVTKLDLIPFISNETYIFMNSLKTCVCKVNSLKVRTPI